MIAALFTSLIARWQVSLGVLGLLILSHGLAYCKGRGDGREAVKIDLREARVEAVSESMERIRKGDREGAKRAEKQAIEHAQAIRAIEEAEAENGNALDSLF